MELTPPPVNQSVWLFVGSRAHLLALVRAIKPCASSSYSYSDIVVLSHFPAEQR